MYPRYPTGEPLLGWWMIVAFLSRFLDEHLTDDIAALEALKNVRCIMDRKVGTAF